MQQGKPDFELLRLKITAWDIFAALDPCRVNVLFIICGCSQPTGISSISRFDRAIRRIFKMKSPKMSGAFYSGCLRIFILYSYNVEKLQSYNVIML